MLRGVRPQDRTVEQVVMAMLKAKSALHTEHHLRSVESRVRSLEPVFLSDKLVSTS